MKFGFYSPYLDTFGGGERYMLTLASHISKNHLVDIFWDDPNIKAPLARFLKIDLSQTTFVGNIFNKSFIAKNLATLGYNWIFVLSDGSVPTTIAANNILHFQVPFSREVDIKTRLKLKRYEWVVCNSHFTKSFIDRSYHVDSKVIYPPVDIKDLKPTKKEKIIISVGRFSESQLHPKKQEVMIEVFKEVYKEVKDWKLILIGQARKEDFRYLRHLKKISRGFAIKILENLPVNHLRDLYSKATIYWHATGFGEDEEKNPQRMEHFGISTVEAQASGVVPVVIDRGGQKEIVAHERNGLLWGTKSQLFELTIRLINDKSLTQKLSQSAIQNSKRFSQEAFFKLYEQIIFK